MNRIRSTARSFHNLTTLLEKNHPLMRPQLKPLDWDKSIDEAKKIVHYPRTSTNLDELFQNDVGSLETYLRQLIDTDHPLAEKARNPASDEFREIQSLGVIIRSVSKCLGHSQRINSELVAPEGVMYSQNTLSEVIEMIKIGMSIHKSVVNMRDDNVKDIYETSTENLLLGNKIALLGGDYIMSKAIAKLYSLRNPELIQLVSSSMRDLADSEIVGIRDLQNNPIPSKPMIIGNTPFSDFASELKPYSITSYLGYAASEWQARQELSIGIYLGKSCQGSVMLAGKSLQMQKLAYEFGLHVAMARQAGLDIEIFAKEPEVPFLLISAPVLFSLAERPQLYELIDIGKMNTHRIDYKTLHEEVLKGSGIDQTRELQLRHGMAALETLDKFPENESRTTLTNIVYALIDNC